MLLSRLEANQAGTFTYTSPKPSQEYNTIKPSKQNPAHRPRLLALPSEEQKYLIFLFKKGVFQTCQWWWINRMTKTFWWHLRSLKYENVFGLCICWPVESKFPFAEVGWRPAGDWLVGTGASQTVGRPFSMVNEQDPCPPGGLMHP